MYITVNETRLYFDVEGAQLVPNGASLREKPTIVLLHGGPGVDHSIYKPAFSGLADRAQIIYLDHRGNGRSDQSRPTCWNLAQWGDDVKAFCDQLGITKPIVFGASFGGFVAQAYATRHADHPGKLILASTAAKVDFEVMYRKFAELGGPATGAAARNYWGAPTSESRATYRDMCVPYYTVQPMRQPELFSRAIVKDDVALHFNGPANEMGRMDFSSALSEIVCPVLIMGGDCDPVMPFAFSERIAASLAPDLVTLKKFEGCAHMIENDDPAGFFSALCGFADLR